MAFKRISSIYFLADSANDLNSLPKVDMGVECFVIEEAAEYKATSDGKWIKQVKNASASGSESVDLSNYATKEDLEKALEESKADTMFGETEENMASNPGSAFGIAVNKGETEGIVDKMIAKGIGLYTFWISKDNADLPAEVKAKNSSCRGLCCVDTVKETGWYGWIQLFDHDGYMYTRYIRNSVPTEWHAC